MSDIYDLTSTLNGGYLFEGLSLKFWLNQLRLVCPILLGNLN